MKQLTVRIGQILTALGFLLSLAAPSSGAEKLRVAYPTLGPGSTPSWVTYEAGFWKKSGLDVELILLGGDARMLPALISGSVDVILGSDTGVTMANLQGANLVRIGRDNEFVGLLAGNPADYSLDPGFERQGARHGART